MSCFEIRHRTQVNRYLTTSPGGVQFKVAGDIIKQDGFGSLYKGLSAGLLRQATYTTARLGIFNNISEKLKEVNEGKVRTAPRQHSSSCQCS